MSVAFGLKLVKIGHLCKWPTMMARMSEIVNRNLVELNLEDFHMRPK